MANVTVYLPKNVRVTVAATDVVTCDQPLTEGLRQKVSYDIGALLSIKPSEARKAIVVKVGEAVAKGDVLAKKSGVFGGKKVTATISGTVTHVDSVMGQVVVEPAATEHLAIVSPVTGKIEKIDAESIVIQFTGTIVFAKQGIGKIKKGNLTVISAENASVPLSDIKSQYRGSVLLGGRFDRACIEKAFGVGVASVMATDIDGSDFQYFEESKMFDPSILLLAKADYATLAPYMGKEAVVEGMHKRVCITT